MELLPRHGQGKVKVSIAWSFEAKGKSKKHLGQCAHAEAIARMTKQHHHLHARMTKQLGTP
jgi:hypothetical protein